jgi:HD-like signal output (HDOD) protein
MVALDETHTLKPFKRRYSKAFLLRNNGSPKQITSEINITQRTLYKKCKGFGLNYKRNNIMTPSLINWTLNTINPHLDNFMPPYDMLESIGRLELLPPMPGIASLIMQLANDPTANAAKLASIIELDPILTAQIIRWASSPLYAYPGKIHNIRESISRVLGFNFVFNLALGLSALVPLKAPKEGPIGTRSFWIQAMASTRLMSLLNNHLAVEHRFEEAAIFQSGLLHDIGLPLMGDQFPGAFDYLNKLIIANPALSIIELERFALGVDHNMLGAWLMRSWNMPKPVVDVVYNNHNPNYRGDNYKLNLLTYLNNYLLDKLGIGHEQGQLYSDMHLDQLNLSAKAIEESLDRLNETLANIIITADMITGC